MSTKDEIRAALEARPECEHEKQAWRDLEFAMHCRDCDADVVAALLPEETETVEWGIYNPEAAPAYWPDLVIPVADREYAMSHLQPGERAVTRTIIGYEKTTPWEDA